MHLMKDDIDELSVVAVDIAPAPMNHILIYIYIYIFGQGLKGPFGP